METLRLNRVSILYCDGTDRNGIMVDDSLWGIMFVPVEEGSRSIEDILADRGSNIPEQYINTADEFSTGFGSAVGMLSLALDTNDRIIVVEGEEYTIQRIRELNINPELKGEELE